MREVTDGNEHVSDEVCSSFFFKWTSPLYPPSPKSSEHLWPGQHTVIGLQPYGGQIHLQ